MARAHTTGLYPAIVEKAIREHLRLPLRSESLERYQDLFADNKQLDLLKIRDWQVIYGRRGTGKTFLLGMLSEDANAKLERERLLAIRITAQDCLVSPAGRDVTDRVRALAYFQTFLELLANALLQHVDRLLSSTAGFWDGRLTDSRRERIEDLALKVTTLAGHGRPVAAFSEYSGSTVTEDTASTNQTIKATAGLSVDLESISLKGGGDAEAERARETQRRRTAEERCGAVPRFAEVRGALTDLLEELHLERLIVLIDEWSTLDPSAGTAIQPEFAELLKRTFAGASRISVKIATNRYQTRFSNRGAGGNYRGLEINADMFEGTNLDHALLSEDELFAFFENLLFKRLRRSNAGVRVFTENREKRIDEQFLLSMFRNRRAFSELVTSAQGIPRDFLLTFNAIVVASGYSVNPTWDVSLVRSCIADLTVTGKQSEMEYYSEADQLLTRCIKPVVTKSASRHIAVKKSERESLGRAIDELLEKRLVHEWAGKLSADLREDYALLVLDYGVWLDWRRVLPTVDESPVALPDRITRETLRAIEIDATLIDRAIVTCTQCQAVFRADARSYLMRGLCPECFMPALAAGAVSTPLAPGEPARLPDAP